MSEMLRKCLNSECQGKFVSNSEIKESLERKIRRGKQRDMKGKRTRRIDEKNMKRKSKT